MGGRSIEGGAGDLGSAHAHAHAHQQTVAGHAEEGDEDEDEDEDEDDGDGRALLAGRSGSSVSPDAAAATLPKPPISLRPPSPCSPSSSPVATSSASTSTPTPWSSLMAPVRQSYKDLAAVIRLKPVLVLILFLATSKVWHAPVDTAVSLLQQRRGVSRETIAFFDTISTPLQLGLQVAVSRFTSGRRPLSLWMYAFPVRLALGIVWLWVIYGLLDAPQAAGTTPSTPSTGTHTSTTPAPPAGPSTAVLTLIFALSNVHAIVMSVMFLSIMSFFSQVADPGMGGTYMTLLNTIANLGAKWPQYFALRGIEWFTVATCQQQHALAGDGVTSGVSGAPVGGSGVHRAPFGSSCKIAADADTCRAAGGSCVTEYDGFVLLTISGAIGGCLWLAWMWRRMRLLEALPRDAWLLRASAQAAATS